MRNSLARSTAAAVGLLVTMSTGHAAASSIVFPVNAQAQVQAVTNIDGTTAPTAATQSVSLAPGPTTTASVTGTSGAAHASVDMTTGQLKVHATSTKGFTATAIGWEFITFSGSAAVDFALAVDGSLSNTVGGGMVYVEPSVRIYDVTSWSNYFASLGDTQYVAYNGAGSPFPFVAGSAWDIEAVRGATSGGCTIYGIPSADCTVNSSGTVFPVDMSLRGTLNAVANQIYLVELQLSTATYNQQLSLVPQVSDFSHTATFGFTNLNGLTFQSSSGQFLAAEVPVPEPGTLTLVGLGMVAAATRRRARRSS